MANLLEMAELAHRAIFSETREKPYESIEEFISTAKIQYAAAMWIYRNEQRATDGMFEMPSDLLSETTLDVKNNEIDISKLDYLASLPNAEWLQSIGGVNCHCKYYKTTLNLSKILCNDDSMPEGDKPFLVVGKKIKFPKGAHAEKVDIIYANTGEDLDAGTIQVNDYVASKVMDKLYQLYGKPATQDVTNNNNPNQ